MNDHRAALVAAGAAAPLLVWWLGWYPAVIDGYGLAQLAQAQEFSFTDFTPAFYGLTIWLVGFGGHAPALVALVQVAALVVLLTVVARRLVRLGVPWWLAGGVPLASAFLPAVGNVAVTLWNDTAAGLAALWVFSELLGLAASPAHLRSRAAQWRLGSALGLWWLYGGGGGIAAPVVLIVLAVLLHRRAAGAAGIAVAAVVLVHAVGYGILPVERQSAHAAEILSPLVGDAYAADPASFGDSDRALLERAAPLDVWAEAADCHDPSLLISDRQFDLGALRESEGALSGVGWRVAARDPLRAAGFRLCAASLLWTPGQANGRHFGVPAYTIPGNDFGFERDPIWWSAFKVTDAITAQTVLPDRLWLWWRPALPLALAAIVYVIAAIGRRRLVWPALALAAAAAGVVVTIQAPGIRPVWGLYVMSWLSLPLLGPALAAGRSAR